MLFNLYAIESSRGNLRSASTTLHHPAQTDVSSTFPSGGQSHYRARLVLAGGRYDKLLQTSAGDVLPFIFPPNMPARRQAFASPSPMETGHSRLPTPSPSETLGSSSTTSNKFPIFPNSMHIYPDDTTSEAKNFDKNSSAPSRSAAPNLYPSILKSNKNFEEENLQKSSIGFSGIGFQVILDRLVEDLSAVSLPCWPIAILIVLRDVCGSKFQKNNSRNDSKRP